MTCRQFDGTVIFTGNKDTTMGILFFSIAGALWCAHRNREDWMQYLISFGVGAVCFAVIYLTMTVAFGGEV